MKKKVLIIISIIIALTLILFIGTGFTKNPNVEIVKYSIEEDGSKLKFSIGIPLSIANTRGYKNNDCGAKTHYLTFYNTFGIISSWGAKFEYVLEVDEDDTEIYFNRIDGDYELVLQKNPETAEWENVIQKHRNDVTALDIELNTILNNTKNNSQIGKYENEGIYSCNEIYFSSNPETKYNLSEKEALEIISNFIEQNKDDIKSMKVEQLLYTNKSNEILKEEIPVSVITLYGVKLKEPSGTPFNKHQLEYDASNFETKIIIDDATKEIINMFQFVKKQE